MAKFNGHYLLDLMSRENKVKFKFNFETSKNAFGTEVEKFEDFLEDAYSCFSEFAMCAFVWEHTPEGHAYWSKVNTEIENEL
jgi:hypothetical protein